MAEIYRSEFAEANRRRSGGDLNAILNALDKDGVLTVVDDPAAETVTDEETGEETEVAYVAGPEIAIQVDADDEAAEEEAEATPAVEEE